MPIRFRCTHCRRLQAISSRKAGQTVVCALCGQQTLVVALQEPAGGGPQGAAGSEEPIVSGDAGSPGRQHTASDTRQSDCAGGARAVRDTGGTTSPAAQAPAATTEPSPRPQPAVEDDEPTFVTRRASTDFEEMDLTPMVDVTFLLLIFFMITASFSLQKTLPFPPPSPDEKGSQQTLQTLEDFEEDSVIVEIDENNVIYVEDTPVTDPAALVDALRDAKKSELVLTAHPDALHETVVKVIDAANEVGMQKIRLAKLAAFDF